MADNITSITPGIGRRNAIEDCSIGVQADPGTVTVSFSHGETETLLVLDPFYARLLSEWLVWSAIKATQEGE